ncbi:Phage integrase family protein [Duganella sp. CF458]|uniref:tyrosine-type recombinase/integrase n=1 Tax=Duganella sp. CF458 TaxID=1884368 RepID=UPI0008ED848E|nr:integrase family protein [Duganella sp. CF458]SFG30230.1 Phage integrase family protein [Duganella sp. CF458]
MPFDARAAKLLPAGQHFTISECPGLRFEVTATKRSWIYRYKSPVDGKMKQTKIGEWPTVSFAAATVAWEKLRLARADGADPSAAKRAERGEKRAAAAAERARVSIEGLTVADVCDNYLVKYVEKNRGDKGVAEVRRMFATMLGETGDLKAVEVTRSVAFDLIESFGHIPVQAAKLRAEIGAAWDYALDSGRLPETVPNWWRLIMRGKLRSKGRMIQGVPAGVTKRVLSEAELAKLIPWLPNFSRLVEDVLTLYLWTCARGSEILAMHADEITEEVDGLWWTVPKDKTKNSWREHATDFRVPLVGRAERIVRRRLDVADGGYLFPSKHCASGHVEQKNVASQVWLHMPYAKTRPTYERSRLPVERWAPHDLRRSSRTLLAALGCPDEVGEAILGHMKHGITGIYNRHTYDKEKREWLARLAPRLEQLANGSELLSLP